MSHDTGADESIGPAADDVRRRVVEQITAGALRPGARLGAERDLAVELGVSRSTLRQALGALESAGVVRRVPGRGGGTFVGHAKIDRDLSRIVGVPELLRDQGFTAGSRVIGTSVVQADAATAAELQLAPDDFVVDIVRIRLADGSPISLEHARFPAARFPGLLELPLGGSVYALLEQEFGVVPDEAVEHIEVVEAGPDEASVLGVRDGAPILSVTRTTRDADGVPIEYSHDLFRADRTRITVRTPHASGSARGRARVVELRPRALPS